MEPFDWDLPEEEDTPSAESALETTKPPAKAFAPTVEAEPDLGLVWKLPPTGDDAGEASGGTPAAFRRPDAHWSASAPRTPEVELDPERVAEPDPREREDWFIRLTDDAKDRCRARWRWEIHRFDRWDAWAQKLQRETIREGAIILALGQLPLSNGVLGIAISGALGAALGYGWDRIGAGRLQRGGSAALVFFLIQLFNGNFERASTDPFAMVFIFCAALFVIAVATMSGMARERRILDGPGG